MKLIPTNVFYIITELSPEEVFIRLDQRIDKVDSNNRAYLFKMHTDANALFSRTINKSSFKIYRRHKYYVRNSNAPLLNGTIEQRDGQTVIVVKQDMGYKKVSYIFTYIIFFIIYLLGVFITHNFYMMLFMSLAIFYYVYFYLLFKYEARESKKILEKILNDDLDPGDNLISQIEDFYEYHNK